MVDSFLVSPSGEVPRGEARDEDGAVPVVAHDLGDRGDGSGDLVRGARGALTATGQMANRGRSMATQVEEAREIRTDEIGPNLERRLPFVSTDTLFTGTIVPLPVADDLVDRYVELVCLRSRTEVMEDGRWYAEVPLLRGAWADGDTEPEALRVLRRAVRAWVLVKLRDRDHDIPQIEGFDGMSARDGEAILTTTTKHEVHSTIRVQ